MPNPPKAPVTIVCFAQEPPPNALHRDSQLQVWSAWKIMKNRVGSTWFEIQAKSSLLWAEKLQGEHELSFRTSQRRFPRTENDDESSIVAYKLQLTPPAGTKAPPAGTEGFSSKLFNLASSSLGRFRRLNPRWKAWNPSKATAPFLFWCGQGNERKRRFKGVLTLSAQFPRRTQEFPVAVYFGLRKKNDLRMYRAPRGERPLE